MAELKEVSDSSVEAIAEFEEKFRKSHGEPSKKIEKNRVNKMASLHMLSEFQEDEGDEEKLFYGEGP